MSVFFAGYQQTPFWCHIAAITIQSCRHHTCQPFVTCTTFVGQFTFRSQDSCSKVSHECFVSLFFFSIYCLIFNLYYPFSHKSLFFIPNVYCYKVSIFTSSWVFVIFGPYEKVIIFKVLNMKTNTFKTIGIFNSFPGFDFLLFWVSTFSYVEIPFPLIQILFRFSFFS